MWRWLNEPPTYFPRGAVLLLVAAQALALVGSTIRLLSP